MNHLYLYIKKLLGNIFNLSFIDNILENTGAFEKAKSIVPFYYYFLVISSVAYMMTWSFSQNRGNFSPIWSIFWASYLDLKTAILVVIAIFLICSIIGAYFFWNRLGRLVGFIGIFQYHAFLSSFYQIDHEWYLYPFIGLLFIFLPDIWKEVKSKEQIKNFLLIFWGAQAFVFLTYSLAGFAKITNSVAQFLQGEAHNFSPDAAALHIAFWLESTRRESLIGRTITDYPLLGWLPFLAVIYFEFFAIYAVFKPSLHRLWALGIIVFLHIGTYITMNVTFQPAIFVLLFLFFNSPFKRPTDSVREIIMDLPIFGWVFGFFPLWRTRG